MKSSVTRYVLLQSFSLLVTGFLLLSIFSVYTGLVGQFYILPTILTLASAVVLRYAGVYHRFSKPTYRKFALALLTVAFIASSTVTLKAFLSVVSLNELHRVFQHGTVRPGSTNFLPEWWIAALLVLAGGLTLIGSVVTRDFSSYPKPTEIREIATSPAYFGFTCTFFGLWAVLFVGISIQRVIIFAPLFEELLKFGVALLVGSTLFGRSLPARIGVALVVGSLFGLVEHATTYPMEADAVYLFRTVFHSMTTILSVSVYTLFESRKADGLLWIAPAYSIMLHFFYNTFVVLSTVISVSVFGFQNDYVPLIYGTAVILLTTGLLLLVGIYQKAIVAIHKPLEHVLSDLV